ncbi:MAG: cob(I)yrinic acid a,c-diamide adenosyltransferase [Gammaproteobacteria bacterium]|nr:MAG: cob(I)yrinic acid a,c-diamide adenosyltransferase [Gammaproteobacteria bacterium]
MTDEKSQRHQERMQQRKEIVDAKIAKATEERGVVIVLTGDGKGKSSSGFGTALRCLGHGYKVAIVQFIKGTWECGEKNFLTESLFRGENAKLEYFVMGTGFTWETQNAELDRAAAEKVWAECEHVFSDPEIHLVLLDEITYMLNFKYLDKEKVVEAIKNRPINQNVIITGRGAKKYLEDLADTFSEVKAIKHAFDEGVKAQKGIEW